MNFTGYEFLKRWEGERLLAYRDVAGIWTIGIGHTKGVKAGMRITPEQSKALLDEDIAWAVDTVNNLVKVPLNQNQFNALVSLCFNIGPFGFAHSTALKRINSCDYEGAVDALTWWNKARVGGKLVVVKGLVNRRTAEKALFLIPDDVIKPEDKRIEELVNKFVADLKKILKEDC
jgi:lysozyme